MREWKQKHPDAPHILDVDVIVMQVIGSEKDFVVNSSHGTPEGLHGDLVAAKEYATRFAAMQIEKTLVALAELEARPVPATVGYNPKPCGLLLLKIAPPTEGTEEHKRWVLPDGSLNHTYAEKQKRALIGVERKRLRGLLEEIGR